MIAISRIRFYNHRMSFPAWIRITFLALAIVIAHGCSSRPALNVNVDPTGNTNSSNTNRPNDSVEELRSLINLPIEPQEVIWRVQSVPPTERLLAVIRVSPEQFVSFSKRLSSSENGKPIQVTVEPWFPPELIAMSETTGEKNIEGISYPANEFFQAPYSEGTVSVIPETDYIIVYLRKRQ